MKRFMMDSQTPRGLGGRRAGHGGANTGIGLSQGRGLGNGQGLSQSIRSHQRQQPECKGFFGRFRLLDASANDNFAGFCIERLQSRIERLHARVAQLKAQADK